MLGALVLLVLATAGFSVGVMTWRTRRARIGSVLDREQIEGFVFVGAAALVLLAVAAAVLGWALGRPGPAEALAVVGLMAYLLYLLVAVVLLHRTARFTSVGSAGVRPVRLRPPRSRRPRHRLRAARDEPLGARSGSHAPASPAAERAGPGAGRD